MLNIFYTTQFKRDIKLIKKRGHNLNKLENVVNYLALEQELPGKYKDHSLVGNYQGYRECHIEPDWLLIYKVDKDNLILTLTRTGSHSDLFQ